MDRNIEIYFDKLDEMVADKRIDNLKSCKTKVVSLKGKYKGKFRKGLKITE